MLLAFPRLKRFYVTAGDTVHKWLIRLPSFDLEVFQFLCSDVDWTSILTTRPQDELLEELVFVESFPWVQRE